MKETNRRQFLQRAAISTAALSLVPALPAATAPDGRWTLRQSCSSINFTRLPIEEACQCIAELGFEAIDIWSAHAGCPHLDDAQKRLGPDGLKTLLEKHRLKLCAFSVYAGGYPRYAGLLGGVGGGVAVRGSAGPVKPKTARKHHAGEAVANYGTQNGTSAV